MKTDELFDATFRGQVDRVKEILISGVSVNSSDENGYTPLHWAVLNGHGDVVRCLLDHGASMKSEKSSALSDAVCCGDIKVAKILLETGADAKEPILFGATPLHIAAESGNVAMVELLVKGGGDPDVKDSKGDTPIDVAISDEVKKVMQNALVYRKRMEREDRRRTRQELQTHPVCIWLRIHGWEDRWRSFRENGLSNLNAVATRLDIDMCEKIGIDDPQERNSIIVAAKTAVGDVHKELVRIKQGEIERRHNQQKQESRNTVTLDDEKCEELAGQYKESFGEHFRCGICDRLLWNEPIVLDACGHSFCKTCLLRQTSQTGAVLTSCPQCCIEMNVSVSSCSVSYPLRTAVRARLRDYSEGNSTH